MPRIGNRCRMRQQFKVLRPENAKIVHTILRQRRHVDHENLPARALRIGKHHPDMAIGIYTSSLNVSGSGIAKPRRGVLCIDSSLPPMASSIEAAWVPAPPHVAPTGLGLSGFMRIYKQGAPTELAEARRQVATERRAQSDHALAKAASNRFSSAAPSARWRIWSSVLPTASARRSTGMRAWPKSSGVHSAQCS